MNTPPSETQPSAASRPADIAAVLFALCYPTVLTYLYFTAFADAATGVLLALFGLLKFVQFAFPLFWYRVIQRRQLELHGPTTSGLGVAIGFGLLVVGAMWLLYAVWLLPGGWMKEARPVIQGKIDGFGANTPAAYLALAIFYSLIHSLLEEYYWRWFVFGELRRRISLPKAVIISSLGFTAHHILLLGTFFGFASPLTWFFSLSIVIGGTVWALMYHRYRSIYPVWIGHLLVDAGIFSIGFDLATLG